jgi:hypothetical protein
VNNENGKWERIEIMPVKPGGHIAKHPDKPEDIYEVKSIQDGYVTALHANGKVELKVFPEEELISDKWWLKK